MKPYLLKSQFLKGLQCHKALWLRKNRPELAAPPDAALQMIFTLGKDVGQLAQALFPGGSEIIYDCNTTVVVEKTQELLKNGVGTIYEAAFRYDNIFMMADILHKGSAGWELYEVKSGTAVKDVNINDVSLQYYVLEGAGLPVSKASLVHINNQYVRSGEIEVHKLFTVAALTDTVKANKDFVRSEVDKIRADLGNNCPVIDIGPYCTDPYDCDFITHCWAHIPEVSVFDIARLHKSKKFDLYYDGIVAFKDIPDDNKLNDKQKMQVEAELTGKDFIDASAIKGFLDTLHYPLYFLDFETFDQAIPPFDGIRPYQKVPFQYSLHLLESENGEMKHDEFLAEPGVDEREGLAKGLATIIPDNACILTYNMAFERGVIQNLADQFPQYKKKLLKMNENIKDLMVPFKGRYYYTKDMRGSYSIKNVLPTLLPDLTYEGMEISNGQDASNMYRTLHLREDKGEVEQIKEDLLEYCKLDTFAMVKLVEQLRDVTQEVNDD